MDTRPKKCNPFRFLRNARKPDVASTDTRTGDHWRSPWPDFQRLFPRDAWRAVEEIFHDPFSCRGVLERWFGDFSSSRFQPRIDVVDEGPVLRVAAELPGIERKDIDVSAEDGTIVLRGEKKQDVHGEEAGCYRLERAYGRFMRAIPMPEEADLDHTLARFDNGVLTLTVPKSQYLRSTGRTIDIG